MKQSCISSDDSDKTILEWTYYVSSSYILILTLVSFKQKLMKNLRQKCFFCVPFLNMAFFGAGHAEMRKSYMSPQKCIVTPDGGLFWGRGALTSVYARILLKSEYYNWRKDTMPRASPRVVWTKRDTNTIQLQSKQEWLRFVHFLSPIIIM